MTQDGNMVTGVFLSIFIVMAGTSSYDFALHPVLADSLVLALASLNKALIKRLSD
jgi:CBS domain-containing membrane protein